MKQPEITRNRTVDLVKTLAIGGVVLIHVAAPPLSVALTGSGDWLAALFWGTVSRASVPLFLMASGTLLLSPEKPLSLKKLYTRSIPRLLLALLFWAACYKVFNLLLWAELTPAALFQALKELILFQHEEHLYYLHMMLLVYAFLPATRLLAQYADRRLLEYLLALWFLLGIAYPTMQTFWPFTLVTGIPAQWKLNMTYACIGYTLLGRYLSAYRKPTRRLPWLLWFLGGVGLTFGGTWMQSAAAGSLAPHFLEGMSVGVCMIAVGIWGLCQTAVLSGWPGSLAVFVSKASFCIFLTHVFFLKLLARWGVNALTGPALVTVPLVTLLVILLSCGTYTVLSRIPGVRRWLL